MTANSADVIGVQLDYPMEASMRLYSNEFKSALSSRDVEDLSAERDAMVLYEMIRQTKGSHLSLGFP